MAPDLTPWTTEPLTNPGRPAPRRPAGPAAGREGGATMPTRDAHAETPLPAHDFRIDLGFNRHTGKLTFSGKDLPVNAHGTFAVRLDALGETRRVLFVCSDPDGLLTLRGIRIAQPQQPAGKAPLQSASGPIAGTPFTVQIASNFLLLEDTFAQQADLAAWPYSLAFEHGELRGERDPEILNEGGSTLRRNRALGRARARRRGEQRPTATTPRSVKGIGS